LDGHLMNLSGGVRRSRLAGRGTRRGRGDVGRRPHAEHSVRTSRQPPALLIAAGVNLFEGAGEHQIIQDQQTAESSWPGFGWRTTTAPCPASTFAGPDGGWMGFEEFATARLPALLRYATILSGDPDLARDLVQEVLVRALLKWRRVSAADE